MTTMSIGGKRWRESDTVKFVVLYEKAECLWNYRHPVYKHRQARDKAIQHIIEEMNMPDFGVNEVKNKIKNIRSTYQQEVNKIKKSKHFGSDIMEEYKTNLAWFPIADRFLSKVVNAKNPLQKAEEEDTSHNQTNQSTLYNLVETEMSNGDGCKEAEEKYPPFTIDIEQIKEELDKDEYNVSDVPCSKRRKATHQRAYSNNEQEYKLEENDGNSQNLTDDIDNDQWYHYGNGLQAQGRLEESDVVVQNMVADFQKDEWYHFGNNISCQLRSLPLERALICQKKIIDILTQERLDYLKEMETDGDETEKSDCRKARKRK